MTYDTKSLADALGRRWVFNTGAPPMAVNLSGFPSDPNKTRPPNNLRIDWRAWRPRKRDVELTDSEVRTKHLPSPALLDWLAWSLSATFDHWSFVELRAVMGTRAQVAAAPCLLVPMVSLSMRDPVGATRSCARFMEGGHVALQTVNDYFVASAVRDAIIRYRRSAPAGALAMRQEVYEALTYSHAKSLGDVREAITTARLKVAHRKLMAGEAVIVEPWAGWADEEEELNARAFVAYQSIPALVTAFVEAARMVTGESPEEALFNAEVNRAENNASTLKL